MSDRQNDFSQGSIPRSIMNLALPMMAAPLVGGLACCTAMYFSVYRPLGRMKDGTPA